jgi:hypothetical protein
MKVYLVNAWYNYYPSPDNTKGIFLSEDDAIKFKFKYEEENKPDWCEILEKMFSTSK